MTAVAVFGGVACGAGASEAEFPSEQIEIIVPFSPGGSADQSARQMAVEAEETCGTGFIVSNQTGGAGAIGFQAVANAEPDGYTLGVAAIELAIVDHLGVTPLPPGSVRGVMQYSLQPVAYAVPADSEWETIDDFVAAAEEGPVTVATSGTGSIYHVGFAGMADEAGVLDNTVNIPFDGASAALQAVLGGQTDMVSVGAAEMAPQVESGDLRPLAVAGEERADILPDTPTLGEEGYEWTSGAILGIIAPPDTPDERIQTLNECLNEARQSESFSSWMETSGFTQEYKNGAEFDAFLAEEYDRYGVVLDSIGLLPEED
ncbi:tripartite tricarboxylate transporter substrate binding protein [Rubrobacter radiotolerans]|uniref:Tripartite tricarboxylate transporter substrate binding protein n=1 Tax=Rubrobacter radiotolerans TaxID=42256 RepID=A0AB35TA97_RUBRA|nr:tripartite tricarboxylate transporter substrate binding protein [Rubrobacter radiotolerans]MDX5893760.1 tripartite tricarboxylate transporter substrate binding protein [Rubrobacter radiotolerans]